MGELIKIGHDKNTFDGELGGISSPDSYKGTDGFLGTNGHKLIGVASSLQTAVFTSDFATNNVFTSVAHGLNNGDLVQLTTATTLPAGLALTTDYWVIAKTDDTFKLSATPPDPISGKVGDEVVVTDDGTGAHTFTEFMEVRISLNDGVQSGKTLCIKDEAGNANANNIKISTEGAANINGSSTATISTDDGSLNLYSNGSNWFTGRCSPT